MAWMAAELGGGEVGGKLGCPGPRCGARLGAWSWAGERCSCGAWVTPAFQVHLGRVDVST
jgi:dual specificity phosphatase 12